MKKRITKNVMKKGKDMLSFFLFLLAGLFSNVALSQINYTTGWESNTMEGWQNVNFGFDTSSTAPCTGSYSLRANVYSFQSTVVRAVNSPALTGSNGGDVTVAFKHKAILYSGGATTPASSYGTVRVKWAVSPTGPWNTFYTINSTNYQAASACSDYSATFTDVPLGGNIYLQFEVTVTSGMDNYYCFDDISVTQGAAPACVSPGELGVSNMTINSATLNWQATSNNYDVEWGAGSFAQGTGTLVTGVTQASYNITGLTGNTDYQFYVRQNCGADGYSSWTGPFTFKTPTDCGGMFYDTGGPSANYGINENWVRVFQPSQVGVKVGLTFTSFAIENNFEFLRIYDGPDVNSPLIGTYTGANSPGTVVSTHPTGALTVRFTSDGSVTQAGWVASVDCVILCGQVQNVNVQNITSSGARVAWTLPGELPLNYNYEVRTSGVPGEAVGLVASGVLASNTSFIDLTGLSNSTEYTFYIRSNCEDLSTPWIPVTFTTLCDYIPLTNVQGASICEAGPVTLTAQATGATVKWYTSATATNPVHTGETYSVANLTATTSYWVESYIGVGCVSPRQEVVALLHPQIQSQDLQDVYVVCSSYIQELNLNTAAEIAVTWSPMTDLYMDATAVTPYDGSSVNKVYFKASNTGVSNAYTATMVNTQTNCQKQEQFQIDVPQVGLPVAEASYAFCTETLVADIPVTVSAGTAVWYTSMTSMTPITAIGQSGTYYVGNENAGCYSGRVPVEISIANHQSPSVTQTQIFCGGGTVADLQAFSVQGHPFVWYTSASSTTPLATTEALVTGTYYVAEVIGGCESQRRAVSVRVVSTAAPSLSSQVVCQGTKIGDVVLSQTQGISFKWYASATATTELPANTVLTTQTYYISRVQLGCESQRAAIPVLVSQQPAAPTGDASQSFEVVSGQLVYIYDIQTAETGVVWYSSAADAAAGVNPLPNTHPLSDGVTYYGVLYSANGCVGLPLAVTVTITLSSDSFELSSLKYYPNPIVDKLTISYKENVDKVTVYNMLGQVVREVNANATQVEVDMNGLSSGKYIVQISVGNQMHTIQVLKK